MLLPPFSLATHTRTALLLTKTELVKPASIYKNELLHVVVGGSTEIFLENLSNEPQTSLPLCEAATSHEEMLMNSSEGMSTTRFRSVCLTFQF